MIFKTSVSLFSRPRAEPDAKLAKAGLAGKLAVPPMVLTFADYLFKLVMMAKTLILRDAPNRIRELRKAARLTLHQLAEKTGIHFANIAKIEKGERGLRHYHMERLAPHLGVKEADLLNADEGGLSREERELINTYRDLPAALRKTYDVLRECHQPFRGAADDEPRSC